jgi:competence protein ComEA
MDILKKLLLITLLTFSFSLYAGEPVNINTADKAALMSGIKGVGEKRAEAIIAWRDQNGPFKSVDDLASVTGIGDAIVEENRTNLTTGEPQ